MNFGPRTSDLQLEDVIDIIFKIKAGFYSFEAANPRHEHEWRVPQKIKTPDGKVLIPGMVTHSNVMIEHPEVVADRIERWARAAGRENIMAGNDCGFQSTAGNTEIPSQLPGRSCRVLARARGLHRSGFGADCRRLGILGYASRRAAWRGVPIASST